MKFNPHVKDVLWNCLADVAKQVFDKYLVHPVHAELVSLAPADIRFIYSHMKE